MQTIQVVTYASAVSNKDIPLHIWRPQGIVSVLLILPRTLLRLLHSYTRTKLRSVFRPLTCTRGLSLQLPNSKVLTISQDMTENKKEGSPQTLRATFIGVTTILFDDGVESLLIDGFFSRPSLLSLLIWNVRPDERKVIQCMERAGIDQRLKAVLVAHTHYDHVLDAPIVCQQTGAKLVGSESTRMIGKGHGLPDEQIEVVEEGNVLTFGSFKVTIVEGIHSPGDFSPGDITEPLQAPYVMKNLKTGKCYSYLIEHGENRIFVHPSANFVPGKLDTFNASTLFLGVGVLGKQSEEFRKDYWTHVVEAIGPARIIPIHWDNFWRSIDLRLSPMPWFADNWSITDRYLKENTVSNNITLQFLEAWEVITI